MEEVVKEKKWYKKWWGITLIVVAVLVVVSSLGDSKEQANTATPTPAPVTAPTEPTISKEQAQKELTEFMDTAKKAKLVSSYEFSDKATVVFIDSMWYTQKVDFKKDFIAKIGLLKKAVTGYTHFEARDAYSNEKVAEITSFSQSIEVYK